MLTSLTTPAADPSPSPSPTAAAPAAPVGASAAAGAANPYVNTDGTLAENWLSAPGLDPTIKGNKTLAGAKTLGDVLKAFDNQERLIGRKGSIIPTDPNDKATTDAYFKAVGWPGKPEGYSAPTLPAGIEANPEVDKTLRGWAHDLHMTDEQYRGLAERIAQMNVTEQANAQADAAQAAEEARVALKTEFGSKYEYNVQLANTAAAAFADEALLARIKAKGWLEDPDFLRYNVAVGSAVSPDRLHANRQGVTDTLSLEQEIGKLETSPEYRDPANARHNAVTEQVLQLRAQLINSRPKKAG